MLIDAPASTLRARLCQRVRLTAPSPVTAGSAVDRSRPRAVVVLDAAIVGLDALVNARTFHPFGGLVDRVSTSAKVVALIAAEEELPSSMRIVRRTWPRR